MKLLKKMVLSMSILTIVLIMTSTISCKKESNGTIPITKEELTGTRWKTNVVRPSFRELYFAADGTLNDPDIPSTEEKLLSCFYGQIMKDKIKWRIIYPNIIELGFFNAADVFISMEMQILDTQYPYIYTIYNKGYMYTSTSNGTPPYTYISLERVD